MEYNDDEQLLSLLNDIINIATNGLSSQDSKVNYKLRNIRTKAERAMVIFRSLAETDTFNIGDFKLDS